MKAFACPAAKCFLAAWPDLVMGAECELETEGAIASAFFEANTQTAFMSLAARQKDFEMALRAQTAQLSILTHRTDPLSPSRKQPGASGSPATTSLAPTPEREEEPSHRSDSSHPTLVLSRSSSLPPRVHCRHCCVSPVVGRVGNSPFLPAQPAARFLCTPSPDVTMASMGICSSPLLPPAGTAAAEIPGQPITNSNLPMAMLPSNDLCVVAINHKSQRFNVLWLSPRPRAPPTPFDVTLPPMAAFCDGVDNRQPRYPTFSPATCGWHAIFERIAQPSLPLDCWGPGSLSKYLDVLTLWKSWDKGTAIDRVGQKPPLQRVDELWGCHRDTRSKKGHLLAWRPRNDENVCRSACPHACILAHPLSSWTTVRGDEADPDPTSQARRKWSQYQFFTRHIEDRIANGGTTLQAIHELDGLRGSRMLPQLHRELQPKRQHGKKDSPLGMTATVMAAGFAGSPNDKLSTGPGAGPPLAQVVPHRSGNNSTLLSAASG